jgi:hypothetical protein
MATEHHDQAWFSLHGEAFPPQWGFPSTRRPSQETLMISNDGN